MLMLLLSKELLGVGIPGRLLGDSSGTGIPVDERLKMGEGAAAWSLPVLERRIIPGTTEATLAGVATTLVSNETLSFARPVS
mmetsp:Transcript_23544/g.54398  ORF Transcript_23544/g.54398 Transcript_23544/m.54398 type:complete len:82 (-) Transcript_23544:388-633(-)